MHMTTYQRASGLLAIALTGIILADSVLAAVAGSYLSPAALDVFDGGRKLLITQNTGKRIDIFDTATARVIRSITLPGEPTGAVCSPEGDRFYVTIGIAPGALLVVEAASGKILKTIPVGHTPTSPILSHDGRTVYVCNRFENAVSVVGLATARRTRVHFERYCQ